MNEEYMVYYLTSTKWLVLLVVALLAYSLGKSYIKVLKEKNKIDSYRNRIEQDRLAKNINIDSIINELNELIKQILEEYTIIELKPSSIVYIKSDTETEIRQYISEEVSKRISFELLRKLEYVVNPDYVGEFIGKQIYFIVLNFKLQYNAQNE